MEELVRLLRKSIDTTKALRFTPEEKLSALALVCLLGDAISSIETHTCAGRDWLDPPEMCPASAAVKKFDKGYRNAKRERLCNACGQAWNKRRKK